MVIRRNKPTLGAIQAAIAFQSPRPSEIEALDRLRAKPVQREAAAQTQLTLWARRQWWGEGYWHIEQATWDRSEALRKSRQGVMAGFPDVLVHIPGHMPDKLALELKAERHRPKRAIEDDWWLHWWPKVDPLAPNEPTRHGVRLSQAIALRLLAGVGYRTKVAYGASEAFEWLCAEIGSKLPASVRPQKW